MTMTKREKTVVRNAIAKLATTKAALTDRTVRSGLKIMLREADASEPETAKAEDS